MFKKRKLISIMLTISMMLTLFPFAAFAEDAGAQAGAEPTQQEQTTPVAKVAEVNGTQYDTLSAAINAVNDGETIKLLDNVSESTAVVVDNGKTFSMDLNGKVLTLVKRMVIKSAFVTVQNGTVKGDIQVNVTDADEVYNSFTLAQNATIDGDYGIIVAQKAYGANNFGSTVNVNGKITGTSSALWVLGNITTDWKNAKNPVVVNVGSTAVLTNPTAEKTALQMAGSCVVTIEDGAQITGGTAVEVRAGKLVVNGGTITGTGTPTSSHPNGSGTSTVGAGIAIAQHTTKLPIDVVVNGGAIKGHTGFYVTNPQNNTEVNQVTATINGGDFVTTGTNAVAKDENATNAGVAVAGGSFTGNIDKSLLAEGFEAVQGSDGKLTVTVDTKSEATWTENGVKKAGTLDAAIKALKDQGGTIVVLKDATITDAEYVLNNKITLQKSASATNAPKIDVTVASGETTIAFNLQQNAGLTLDGVAMTVKGTKNADSAKKNDGTAFNVNHSNSESIPGANLTLENGAVLTVTDLERGLIFSGTDVKTQATVNVNPGTTMNITNIDGNASNGGEWAVDKATLNVKNCGELGLSAQKIVAKNGATINVDGAGKTGVLAKDLVLENGSDLNVSNCGAKLPFYSNWSPDKKSYKNAVEIKMDGNVSLSGASEINLTNNKDQNGKDINNVYLPKGDVSASQNSSVNGNIVNGEPVQGDYRVEYIVNGEVYYSVTVTAKNDKVTYTAPKDPSRSGYTFKGWDYNGADVTVATDNQASFKPSVDKNVYQFVAKFSSNTSAVTEYSVTVKKTDNGSVVVSPKRAEAGDKVTITVDPDKGYVVDAVAVTDKDGDKITVTKKTATKYTFTMPKSRVDVKVTFKVEQTEPEQPSEMPFVDVVKDAWYYPAVEYVYNNELMNGTNGGLTFEPNVNLNRAMMAAVLYNMEGGPDCDKSGLFSDVADGMWYTDAVNWAASNNIVSGMPDGTYAPNQALTREQMASILYRYAEYKGIDTDARADLGKFTDGNTTSAWATDVVQWAVAEKLINGVGTELQPKGTASRAQVATVLMNYCENVAK